MKLSKFKCSVVHVTLDDTDTSGGIVFMTNTRSTYFDTL